MTWNGTFPKKTQFIGCSDSLSMKNQIGDIKNMNNEESEMKTVAIVNLRIKAKFLHTPKSKWTYCAGATY